MPAGSADRWFRHPLVACLLLGLLVVGAYLGAEIYLLDGGLGFPLDDSWIHLQFARNMAAGEGLSYNPGDLVTGSTAPLWTALLSLTFVLPGSVVVWVKIMGSGLFLLVIAATYRLCRELGVDRISAALGGALTAVTSWLVWSALSGMEIPLFALLSLEGTTQHLRERKKPAAAPYSALILALAALARPEGFLLLLAALADRLIGLWRGAGGRDRRATVRLVGSWLLLAAIVLLPTLLFYRATGEGFLPTTYSAKSPGLQRWLPSVDYLKIVLGIFFPAQPIMTLLALGGALVVLREGFSEKATGLLPVLWVLGLPLAYSLISGLGPSVVVGNFGRYYFPLFPFVIALGTLAIDRLLGDWMRELAAGSARVAVLALAVLVLLPSLMNAARGMALYTRSVINVEDSDVAMARWLAERLDPDAVLAVNDIGALRFFLPNDVVDLAGIGNPEIRRYFSEAESAGGHWTEGVSRFLEDHRPDYLVVFPSWFPGLVQDRSRFQPQHQISIEQNITMGGDELVLYSTPWTRYPLTRR